MIYSQTLDDALRYPVGTLLDVWASRSDGNGYRGTWLVGEKSIWDVHDILNPSGETKDRSPGIVLDGGFHLMIRGDFGTLGRSKREAIIERLKTKGAESRNLWKNLKLIPRRPLMQARS